MKYSKTLRSLKLATNRIVSLDGMVDFILKMKELRFLDLRNNPICQEKGYRIKLMGALKINANG